MKRNTFRIIIAGVAVALAAWQFAPAGHPGDAGSATVPASATMAAPATHAGYVVHVDENGQIVEEPGFATADEFNAALEQSISTSSEGLVEEASPVGGGVMVNLQGRFQSTSTAAVDANGNLVVPCLTNEDDVRAFTSSPAAAPAAAKE